MINRRVALKHSDRLGPLAAALCALGLLASCGGDLGGGGAVVPGSNVASIFVDGGPAGAVNGVNAAYVSVSVCAPGSTTNCQIIDHVLLDTGSTGLRLLASVAGNALTFPQEVTAASNPLWECLGFANSYAWGSVRLADVQIADGKAMSLPIQLIADPTAPAAPTDCTSPLLQPPPLPVATVAALNANGVLGVGVFREDCGTACNSPPPPNVGYQYYVCTPACAGALVDTALQLQNPVLRFATNNNGVVIDLPAVGAAGSFGARGSLILGIGTQSNNALGNATVLATDAATGYVITDYNGLPHANSFIDSGSRGIYFDDAAITACPVGTVAEGLYCPGAPLPVAATVRGNNGASVTVNFSVGDALSLLDPGPPPSPSANYNAFSNFAGPFPKPDATAFDWGLPFFYGRKVFVGIEGQSATAPYFAF